MSWLKELSGDWSAAKEKVKDLKPAGGGAMVPDGNHKAVIVDAIVDQDRPMIKFALSFPEFKNIVRTKVIFVSGKLEYVHRELGTIGCDVDDPALLPVAVKTAVGKVVEVAVKTKPGEQYAKIYFNKDTGERVALEGKEVESDDPSKW